MSEIPSILSLLHQVGDRLDEVRLVDHVGDLGHDDALGAVLMRLRSFARARTTMWPRPVRYASRIPARPKMMPPVGKSGPCTTLQEVLVRHVRVVDDAHDAVDDLAEVVRRDVRGHPDGDARRAVHEEVREFRREDDRLLPRLVVVRDEVDRVLLDVREAAPRPRASSALPCTARPPRCPRRRSRSCPARPRAGSGGRSPAPDGPSCRRPPTFRAGGSCRSRLR